MATNNACWLEGAECSILCEMRSIEFQEAYYLYKLPYLILICCFHVLIGHLTDAFLFGNLRQLILIQNFVEV